MVAMDAFTIWDQDHLENIKFRSRFLDLIDNQNNPYHPLTWILGRPVIGRNVYIGGFSEVNANKSSITIGDNCDIGSFVVINCADSHKKTIGISREIERKPIVIENNVFIGTQSSILGGCHIGHHSVVAAGCILKNVNVPPMSLVLRNGKIKKDYYRKEIMYEDINSSTSLPSISWLYRKVKEFGLSCISRYSSILKK